MQFQKPIWEVQTGRRDGLISVEAKARKDIPSPSSNFSQLKQSFANKGLTVQDLVVLSGSTTKSYSHARFIDYREV